MTQQEQIRKEQEEQIAAPRKPYQGLVQSVSNIFHPLLVLTYTALVICLFTRMQALPFQVKAWFVGMVSLYTLVLPVLIITMLHVSGLIGHWALRDRRDRMVPFFTNFACYLINARNSFVRDARSSALNTADPATRISVPGAFTRISSTVEAMIAASL